MSMWSVQEDNLLKQQMALGLSDRQVYERYGELFNDRTLGAIRNRMSLLRCDEDRRVRQRKKEKYNNQSNVDESNNDKLIESLDLISDKLCNRLDTIIKQQAQIVEEIQLLDDREDKRCNAYVKALYEIKTAVCDTSSNTQTISNYFKRVMHKMKW